MEEIAVIGIGNILRRDDGMGVHVIRQLEKEGLPSTVTLVDGGTSTLAMLRYFTDCRKVVIVDCLAGGFAAGTVYRLQPEDLPNCTRQGQSLHGVQILDVVRMANALGKFPDVVIIGIEPEDIGYGLEMSALMRETLPAVIGIVMKELPEAMRPNDHPLHDTGTLTGAIV